MSTDLKVTTRQKALLRSELEKIRKRNSDGLLVASEVVDEARHPDSPLHSSFEWDDEKAAEHYRLAQARALIRCVIIEDASGKEAPAYVSLMDDRQNEAGGYRKTEDILDSKEYLAALERTAKVELESWTRRYQVLTGLVTAVAKSAGIESPAIKKRKAK